MNKISQQIQQWKRCVDTYEKAKQNLQEKESRIFEETLKTLGLTTPELQFGAILYLQEKQQKMGKEAFIEEMENYTMNAYIEYLDNEKKNKERKKARDQPIDDNNIDEAQIENQE